MKEAVTYFTIILLLASCNSDKQSASNEMSSLYPAPQTVALNTEEGYIINQVTGDTIQPLINSLGDTIKTGVPVPAIGKTINPGSVAQPKSIPAGKPEVVRTHLNVKKIPETLTVIPVNKNSLKTFTPGVDSSSFVLVNSTGDTVPTGLPIPAKGIVVPCLQPQPVKAFPPRMKDNANINMKYLDVDQGMISPGVSSILEDSQGNLWFGTYAGGLSMYNGVTFTHFTLKEGVKHKDVRSILEDSHGNLWFASNMGVSMYNGETFTHFTEKEGLSNNDVKSILEDSHGNLWFGTNGGVSMYNGETFTHFTEKEGLSDNRILSILEDSQGNLWFGTGGGGVSKYDGETFTHFTEKEGLSNNEVWSSLEDSHGNLWFGTNGGVSMYNGETFTHFTEKEGLSYNWILSILEDSHGNLWFGTNSGVSMYNSETFTHFIEKEGLSNNYVWSILEDSNGNLWFGTKGGGVSMYNGETFTHFTEKEGLSDNRILSILEDRQGNLWFGTWGGGVSMYNGETFTHFTKKEGLSNNYIRSILEDSHGNLWFASNMGVSMYNGETFTHFTEKEGLSNNEVWSSLEDSHGNLWFGIRGGGVSMYNGKTFTHFTEKEGLCENYVLSILEDSYGNLWFSTWGRGMIMYNGESFTYFTEKEGLINNYVWSILEDNDNNIWLGTTIGLNRLVFRQGSISGIENSLSALGVNPIIHTYSVQDGLKSMTFNFNSALLDSKNRIWWGSRKSLTMLDMNNFKIPSESPAIHLNRIEINEEFADYRHLKDSASIEMKFDSVARFYNYPLNLKLPYNRNHLTFHFSAIDWSAPHKIKYSYKMEGSNDNWSLPTTETTADYRNMPYGTFTFKVRAIGAAQKWSDTFEYTFTIRPPWWFTWLARTGYGIAALLLILGIVRWRTAKLKQRQKELEQTVKDRTVEISEKNEELNLYVEELASQRDEIEAQRDMVTKQKDEIQEQKQATTDSIQYASRIQTAILPPDEVLKYLLPKHFILYKPRDIVSGDFYWLTQKREKIIIVVADCTGHGVPGAFMSMLGNALLNDIVNNIKTLQANIILNELRDQVMVSLRQTGKVDEAKDGMDIALCILDKENMALQYAGGFNPLYLIRNEKLTEIKADKMPIGISSKAGKSFTNNELTLQKDDTLYMSSDGYIDQFGGPKGKKFISTRFKQLLLDIQDKIMFEQKEILEQTLKEWMGITGLHEEKHEQIDDIIVMGIKI
ncbi:MAG: SpoIIE family protein phosphatase [Bacteroidales bacterium]|nr:SpoIIE family protein phosphatase [Bacteroidales bacterium]